MKPTRLAPGPQAKSRPPAGMPSLCCHWGRPGGTGLSRATPPRILVPWLGGCPELGLEAGPALKTSSSGHHLLNPVDHTCDTGVDAKEVGSATAQAPAHQPCQEPAATGLPANQRASRITLKEEWRDMTASGISPSVLPCMTQAQGLRTPPQGSAMCLCSHGQPPCSLKASGSSSVKWVQSSSPRPRTRRSLPGRHPSCPCGSQHRACVGSPGSDRLHCTSLEGPAARPPSAGCCYWDLQGGRQQMKGARNLFPLRLT